MAMNRVPAPMRSLSVLGHYFNRTIPQDVVQKFEDIERDRNRTTAIRTLVGPAGALGMHLPVIPASMVAGATHPMVSPAQAFTQMLGLDAPLEHATLTDQIAPWLLMSGLGGLGAVMAGMAASKFFRRKPAQPAQPTSSFVADAKKSITQPNVIEQFFGGYR